MVTILSFALIHIIPGDPAAIMLGAEATQEQINDLRHQLYLDRAMAERMGLAGQQKVQSITWEHTIQTLLEAGSG